MQLTVLLRNQDTDPSFEIRMHFGRGTVLQVRARVMSVFGFARLSDATGAPQAAKQVSAGMPPRIRRTAACAES